MKAAEEFVVFSLWRLLVKLWRLSSSARTPGHLEPTQSCRREQDGEYFRNSGRNVAFYIVAAISVRTRQGVYRRLTDVGYLRGWHALLLTTTPTTSLLMEATTVKLKYDIRV
jgi:hypothetical protein